MLSRVLYIPFGFGGLLCLYLGMTTDNVYYNYLALPLVILLVVNYVLSPQIDWWYYKRFPPKLDERTKTFLQNRLVFYQGLNETGKQRFEQRMAMFPKAHEFILMHLDSLPEEVQTAIAASAVQLTFGQEDFLLEAYEKLVVYPTSFLSPRYPNHMHSSEIHTQDGAMMFSARHVMHGFVEPDRYYHTALHECIQAWIQLNSQRTYPELPGDIWSVLQQISQFPQAGIQEWIGLSDINPMAVSICHFLVFSSRFQEVSPTLYQQISQLLNLDPLESEQPILYIKGFGKK